MKQAQKLKDIPTPRQVSSSTRLSLTEVRFFAFLVSGGLRGAAGLTCGRSTATSGVHVELSGDVRSAVSVFGAGGPSDGVSASTVTKVKVHSITFVTLTTEILETSKQSN